MAQTVRNKSGGSLTTFLLGAGCSAADGAPTMSEYLTKIEEVFGRRPEWRKVRLCLESLYGKLPYPPINVVLDLVYRLESSCPQGCLSACAEVMPSLLKLMYGTLTPFEEDRDSFDAVFGIQHADAVGFYRVHSPPNRPVYGLSHADAVKKRATACLSRLLVRHAENVAVLSTNWDIILDQTLVSQGAHVDYGPPGCLGGGRSGPSVRLLKLHGSVNWAECTSCHRIQIWPNSYPLQGLMAGADLGTTCDCGNDRWNPVVVHPIPVNGPAASLEGVWTKAAEVLQRTCRLVVIGYSLPEMDCDVRTLLSEHLAAEAPIMVIDPNPAVWQRFEGLFPGRVSPMSRGWSEETCCDPVFVGFAFPASRVS